MYKEGIRWTECMETFGRTDITYMVLDYILLFLILKIILKVIISHIIHHCHHISGAWPYKLQQEWPAGKQHELAQHE